MQCGIRVLIDAPLEFKTARRSLVIYATPNGSSIEQTLGCSSSNGLNFRFDIQHVAAQIRRLREIDATQDVVLAVVEAPKLSWPSFSSSQADAGQIIQELVESLRKETAADRVVLSGHSGGGSFLFGYIKQVETLPGELDRIVFLDANYSYTEALHRKKLLTWLTGDSRRKLVVVAYDDREITLNGKKVVGPDGGTFRATQRMEKSFSPDVEWQEETVGPFRNVTGMNGQIQFFIHANPDNKILHTALVGDMNGLLHGLTLGTDHASDWGQWGGPRAYSKWVQSSSLVEPVSRPAVIPESTTDVRLKLPPRPNAAPSGSQFQQQISSLSREERETAVVEAIVSGNVPDFVRRLIPIQTSLKDSSGQDHVALYWVMPDYVSVGSDDDFYRIPMMPQSARRIAAQLDASLITPKISEDIFSVAQIRLKPQPMTQDRDHAATFFQHHNLIEDQLRGKDRRQLVVGIKKDVVLSNRLKEKPHRVAIYGWHYPDGRPIQTLYVGHVDWYVDYSHGIRLMADHLIVDGQSMTVEEVLRHPVLNPLLSDEGPMDVLEIEKASGW